MKNKDKSIFSKRFKKVREGIEKGILKKIKKSSHSFIDTSIDDTILPNSVRVITLDKINESKLKYKIMKFEKKDLLVMGGEKSIGKPSLKLIYL